MATFRSSIKIFSELSTKQGCRPFTKRSNSVDRNFSSHKQKSSDWIHYESNTALPTSRSSFSLFRQKKPTEIQENEHETDMKQTPENESCLPCINSEDSREMPTPLSYNYLSQIKLEHEPKEEQHIRELQHIATETCQLDIPLKFPRETNPQPYFAAAKEEPYQWTPNNEIENVAISTVKHQSNLKFLPNHIIKRNHSSFMGDPLWQLNRGSYECQGGSSRKKCQDEATEKKKRKQVKECVKKIAPDCKEPLTVDCRKRMRYHPPCALRPAPKPSYSECLKDPTPPLRFTECKLEKETDCPPPRRPRSHDGCEIKREKEDICPVTTKKSKHGSKSNDEESIESDNFKFKGSNAKLSMICSPQNFIAQQYQPIKRSYSLSYFNHKPLVSYEDEGRIRSQRDQCSKRSYSLTRTESGLNRNAMQCAKKNENASSPPTTDRSCKKISDQLKETESSTCNRIKAPGCKTPEFADCREQEKSLIVETCTKIYPPHPSFSECIRDPPPPVRFTECRSFVEKCPEKKKKKSYDGCNPEKPPEIPCPEPRDKKTSRRRADCDDSKADKCDDEPSSWSKPAFIRPPMMCLPSQNTKSIQNQIIKRSYSYINLNSIASPQRYQITFNYPRNASSYSFIEPPNCGNNNHMKCANNKGSKSEPPSCGKVDSGVKKEKSKKSCNKVTAPGCKAPKSVDCVIIKELPPCKKVCAPKKSYSECLREQTPPRPFTECLIRKPDICPGQKPVEKSYDGCAPKKKKEIECPEPVIEKPIKPKKKVRDVCDPKEECDDVEPFKFKSGYSKPPMKCSCVNVSQHNLHSIRLYSDLKTENPNKQKFPYKAPSYTDVQINTLKIRSYSNDEKKKPTIKKSKYDTIPCPEDPDPPCRPKEEGPGGRTGPSKCGDAIIPAKHFIECVKPKEKKRPICETAVKKLSKPKIEVKVEPPKPKTYIECPKPKPRVIIDPCAKEPPPPPPVKVCPIKDKHFIECLKPPTPPRPTCENPTIYKKEERVERPHGICRGDRLVKTFIECPQPPSKRKGMVCDPYKPRMEPCFGQVKQEEGKVGSRKKCGVDPDDTTPACPEKKKDERRKCSQHPTGTSTSMSFPPFSTGSTMKYSTSKSMENQNFSKNPDFFPAFCPDENSLTVINFTGMKQRLHTSDNMRETATIGAMGCSYPKQTDHLETLKKNGTPIFSPNNGATVNFSTSKISWKNNSSFCKKVPNSKSSQASEHVGKCNSGNSVSPNINVCEKPVVKPKLTCEAISKCEKKTVKSATCKTEEKSVLDICQKPCRSSKEGTLEDLLCIIKSWFSFLKAREGCPEPGRKRKSKQIKKIECNQTKHDICISSPVKQVPCQPKCEPGNLMEDIQKHTDKTSKIEIHVSGKCGSNLSSTDKCPKITMPGCKIPESISCSKQVNTSEPECKKIPAPIPSFSECTKELLEPPRFTECNISEFDKCQRSDPVIKPSACEIYFKQNKKHMKPEKHCAISMEFKHLDKMKSDSICKVSSEPCPAETNMFSRLLNKKSKLPECQKEEQCIDTRSQNRTMEQMIRPKCQLNKGNDPNKKQAILDSKKTDGVMVDIKKVKKGGPVKITIEGICDPDNASSSNTKKATDCTIGEADKNKDCITEPYVQSQPPKTEKSISSNTKKNIGNTSKKFMLSHDISKIQKRAYSTSPMNRVVGNKIYERAIVPYPVVDVDNISKIKLKSTSRPSLKIKVPQPIKTTRTLKTQHKIYEKKKRQENGILQTKLAKEYSPSKIHNKSPFVQVKANSYYLPADCVNIERIKDLSYQYLPTEETSYDSYLTFINKFPQMMQRTVGSNCLSDIWSYCQKDLPLNSILKVPVSVNQKSNPKVDLPVSQSRLSQTKEADKCENIDAEENK